MNWERGIYFTRSRPYKKNDQATIESERNHLVRRNAFYYRYDTSDERVLLKRLWRLVGDRLNYLTPTIEPVGYATGVAADSTTSRGPRSAGYCRPQQEAEMTAYRDALSPARLARDITDLQTRLTVMAKEKTE
ncbi:hypothetical protein GCM10023147_51030 [Tsukamurella soli]|uniref:Transposase n=2 Tax=Tsukamurella soli TaxID=644556 RepID=A0ABP8KI08_9ACTN